MLSDIDEFVDLLKERILDETRQAYGAKVFQRWIRPRFMGRISHPDGYSKIRGACGDGMEFFLSFEGERVRDASFMTDGCGTTTACGAAAAEMAQGKSPEELLDITAETIESFLGGLPEPERHCALLAATALQEALHDYMVRHTRSSSAREDE